MRAGPVHFEKQAEGSLAGDGPVRMSTAARLLRAGGHEVQAAELEAEAKIAAPWCQQCERAIPDPVIGICGDRVAYACPHCSSPEVLARWKTEGGS